MHKWDIHDSRLRSVPASIPDAARSQTCCPQLLTIRTFADQSPTPGSRLAIEPQLSARR